VETDWAEYQGEQWSAWLMTRTLDAVAVKALCNRVCATLMTSLI
jgi:hypothetical protein